MKATLALILIGLACIDATHGQSALLGGFQGTNDTALQSPTATGVTVTLTASTGDITPGGGSFQSNPSTWGTRALDVAPTDTGSRQIVQSGTITPWSLTLTITNDSAPGDVTLDSIHYWTKKDVSNQGPPSATFAYTGGDPGAANSTSIAIANGTTPTDFALNTDDFLTDLTLAVGESATFTWTTDAPQNPAGNTGLRIDNFAISGTVDTGDITPPNPATMTWETVPTAIGESRITMTATAATDISGVEYHFAETSGNFGGSDSGWQDSPSYTDTNLDPATEYSYTVTARDKSVAKNETLPSDEAFVTTGPADETPPSPSPITFLVAPVPVSSGAISMTAATATDPSGVEYYFEETSGNPGGSDSGWQDSPTHIDTGLDPATEYSYTVVARDKSYAGNETLGSTAVATTHPVTGSGAVLIGGFHGANETALQSSVISGADVTLTSTTGDITQGTSQIGSTLWGTTGLDVPSPGNQQAIFQRGTLTPFTLTMTITNNGAGDLPLDSLHFIVKKDINNAGPRDFTIAYTAGDLGGPASTIIGLPNGINGFDVPLASFLADTTLASAESATFTWTPGAPENPGGNTSIRLDNLAISGTSALAADAPLRLVITPNPDNAGNYDFSWNSLAGKVYDLVSNTSLDSAPETWEAWNGHTGMAATPGLHGLTNVPGGGVPHRFFAVIERDAP